MAVVIDFHFRVETCFDLNHLSLTVFVGHCNIQNITGFHCIAHFDIECFTAVKTIVFSILSVYILHSNHTHHYKLCTVYSFVACCDNSFDTQHVCTFGCPVTAGSHTVVVACNDDKTCIFFLILHCSVIDAHHFTSRPVRRETALCTRCNLVTDTDVCKCTAHHHFMVT